MLFIMKLRQKSPKLSQRRRIKKKKTSKKESRMQHPEKSKASYLFFIKKTLIYFILINPILTLLVREKTRHLLRRGNSSENQSNASYVTAY